MVGTNQLNQSAHWAAVNYTHTIVYGENTSTDTNGVGVTDAFYKKVHKIKKYILANIDSFDDAWIQDAMEEVPWTMRDFRYVLFTKEFRELIQVLAAFELMTEKEYKTVILAKFAPDHDFDEEWFVVTQVPNGESLDTTKCMRTVSTHDGWRKYFKGDAGAVDCSGDSTFPGFNSYDEMYVTGEQHEAETNTKRLAKEKSLATWRILAHNVRNPLFPNMPTSLQKHANGPFELCGSVLHLLGTKHSGHIEHLCK